MRHLQITERHFNLIFLISRIIVVLEWIAINLAIIGLSRGFERFGEVCAAIGAICGFFGFLLITLVGGNSPRLRKKALILLFWAWLGLIVAYFGIPPFFTA